MIWLVAAICFSAGLLVGVWLAPRSKTDILPDDERYLR